MLRDKPRSWVKALFSDSKCQVRNSWTNLPSCGTDTYLRQKFTASAISRKKRTFGCGSPNSRLIRSMTKRDLAWVRENLRNWSFLVPHRASNRPCLFTYNFSFCGRLWLIRTKNGPHLKTSRRKLVDDCSGELATIRNSKRMVRSWDHAHCLRLRPSEAYHCSGRLYRCCAGTRRRLVPVRVQGFSHFQVVKSRLSSSGYSWACIWSIRLSEIVGESCDAYVKGAWMNLSSLLCHRDGRMCPRGLSIVTDVRKSARRLAGCRLRSLHSVFSWPIRRDVEALSSLAA